jgi:hypothetical protein
MRPAGGRALAAAAPQFRDRPAAAQPRLAPPAPLPLAHAQSRARPPARRRLYRALALSPAQKQSLAAFHQVYQRAAERLVSEAQRLKAQLAEVRGGADCEQLEQVLVRSSGTTRAMEIAEALALNMRRHDATCLLLTYFFFRKSLGVVQLARVRRRAALGAGAGAPPGCAARARLRCVHGGGGGAQGEVLPPWHASGSAPGLKPGLKPAPLLPQLCVISMPFFPDAWSMVRMAAAEVAAGALPPPPQQLPQQQLPQQQ